MLTPIETKKRQQAILEKRIKLKNQANEAEKDRELAKAILGLILVACAQPRRKKRWYEYL